MIKSELNREVLNLVHALFNQEDNHDINNQLTIMNFYNHITYTLESNDLIKNYLNIKRSTQLQKCLKSHNYLNILGLNQKQIPFENYKEPLTHLLFCAFQEQPSYSILNLKQVNTFYKDLTTNNQQLDTFLKQFLNVQNELDLADLFIYHNNQLELESQQ